MSSEKNKAAILLNGALSYPEKIRPYLREVTHFIAADGGLRHASAHGFPVHQLVGDMDSVSPQELRQHEISGTDIIRFPADKDQTDLEIAIRLAADRGFNELHLLGIEGGRSDHLFAILTTMGNAAFSEIKFWAYDAHHRITILQGAAAIKLAASTGTRLSLLPLSGEVCGVSLSGTKWTLQDATLLFGNSLTLSNQIAGPSFSLSQKSGRLAVFIEFPKPGST